MKKAELTKMIAELKDVRAIATMETASFDTWRMSPRLDIDKPTLNAIVKSTTEVWRGTWLLTPLDLIIEKLEAEYNSKYGKVK